MKAIHADPKEIRKIFTDKYLIPDFQRPYSWEIEHCDKLWDDLISFYYSKESIEDKYFLGNIVIHPQDTSFALIDGQQRLTTLLLLIKALHQRAGTVKALEECIKTKDPLTSELTTDLRLISEVFEKDKEYLYDIIFNDGNDTPDWAKLKINFEFLNEKIKEWWLKEGNSPEKLNGLILTVLDQIVLLPIHCGSEDDALIIFETINNRGMSLTDADIFKAKLHRSSNAEKDIFIKQWNSIENHLWLFRIYMHIIRAQANDSGKEIALRTYFTSNGRLTNWKMVMNSLLMISDIECNWGANEEIDILWNILYTYPNYYWNFPLFVFLHKYGHFDKMEFVLPVKYVEEFTKLLHEITKYFFIKGVVHNSVNAVRDTIFKVCALIESGDDYNAELKKNLSDDYDEFARRISVNQYGRYLRGLVLISAYLNPDQDNVDFVKVIKSGYHIEHILPRKWNNYDGWTEESWDQQLNTLGNLIPLEWKLNISAKNEFFDRKKESYKESLIQDAKDLLTIKEWYPRNCTANQEEKLKRLLAYFK